MNNENYQILGLNENASDEEMDGEVGTESARMLGKIDSAYTEIMSERRERKRNTGSSILDEVANAIKNGDLVGAQAKLDECNERNGEWHYLQSVLFFRKNWMNESKKQLEIALQLDPNNTKYKDAYERINSRMNYQNQTAYETPNGGGYADQGEYSQQSQQQMGGSGCAQCVDCCYTYLCVNCLFNLCCGCR